MIQLVSQNRAIDSENFIFVAACDENNYAINAISEVYAFGQVKHQKNDGLLDPLRKQKQYK